MPNGVFYKASGGGAIKGNNVWGVTMDATNSNPETALTYTDDALMFGLKPGESKWDRTELFKGIKPCLFKNGAVVGYLDKNDFTKFEDGSAADITSGNAGDVMIEIPKIGFKINRAGDILSVQLTTDPNRSAQGFRYWAHTISTEGDRDKLYIAAYKPFSQASKLRSISGVTPTATGMTFEAWRNLAKANGSGYALTTFYPLFLLQCLYIIRFKNLNSKSVIGVGATGSTGVTGATNKSGMYYGGASNAVRVKCHGIEDLWGNQGWWVDGTYATTYAYTYLWSVSGGNSNTGFSGSGQSSDALPSGNDGYGSSSTMTGYPKTFAGDTKLGFSMTRAKDNGGSATTYFCDMMTTSFWLTDTSRQAVLWLGGSGGIFDMAYSLSVNGTYGVSPRLMYL